MLAKFVQRNNGKPLNRRFTGLVNGSCKERDYPGATE